MAEMNFRGGLGDVSNVDLEVRMQHESVKADAMQYQMQQQALDHAREVQTLKQRILERDRLVDTMKYGGAQQNGY